ncbi:MAG TPA: GAF domain-containing protein [Anaerolineales bacterium]|nr:GAF domain-containing protein [Anaerolineales bacterium]
MPKKKPIVKRLDRLFDDIRHEEPSAKPAKPHVPKEAPVEKTEYPVDVRQSSQQRTRPVESVQSIKQTASALALAFQTSPNNWATLQVESDIDKHQWSEEDQLLVKQVTDQLALALENARLFQDAQRRVQEMTALADVGREISATLQIESVLERMAQYAKDLLQAETSAVYLPDENIGAWRAVSVLGVDAEEIKSDPIKTGRGIIGNIAVTKEGRIVNNASQAGDAVMVAGTKTADFEHIMGVPILSLDRVTGLMAVWRTGEGDDFSPTELDFLTNLAQQASIAIENARLFQSVNESQGQLSEALRIARIGYFEIDWVSQEITLTDELFSLLNTSAEKEGGYQLPLDQTLQKFVVEDDIPVAAQAVEDAISAEAERSEVTSEVRYKTHDGRIIWVSSTYKVERDNQGNPVKVAGSSQDITERKTNELTQAAITHISESALTAQTMEELFQTTHDSIRTVLPSKNFFVALYDRETNMINFPYHADELDDDWAPRKLGKGLTSYVIRSGKPLRTTPEIYADLHASGEILSDGAPSVDWLGVPLRSAGVIRGVMAVQTYDKSIRIDESQVENFTLIGSQTAAALERLQARESLQRQNTYLAASAEIGNLVTSTLNINTIFTRTVNLIGDRLGFYFTGIYEIDEDGFHVVLREGTGGAGEAMKIQKHRVAVDSQTVIGQAAETGETLIVNDVSAEPLYQPNPLLLDTESEVAIPLKVGGKVLGVIDIQSIQSQIFSPNDVSVLQSLADQVAVSINNANLYDESQELIKNLQEVDQLKSQFLANMSHELRTPLNSIIGFSRVILKGIDGPVTEMQNQDLTAIYNSGQHLLGLINDILDLARIEAGKMELNFEEVNLGEMVHSVFSTAKGLVKEKPIQLVEKVPADMPTARGDTMRVRQVLLNLISNASKFTDEGSITVQTEVQTAPNGSLEALINIIDTGPGISPEGQERLFKAFSQVDGSATRKSGGSGLGLSICANLVQLHNGRIGVHSEEGKGSTFWFTLPLYQQPAEDIPEGKKVVLAIDDDPQVISLYERYLNPQGYHVVPLTDPSRAKDRITELNPFAVTLDLMMPDTDGWTVLTDLKSDPATRDIPIIICSIVDQSDKGFNLGAADYLVKPIAEEDIVNALTRINKNGNIHEVLVIDDDSNDLRLIEKILKEHGQFNATLANGGQKGWEAINNKPPDAIILDIFMPDMDGFTILEKLREDASLRNIPIIVVSGGELSTGQQKQLEDYGQRLITKGSLKEDDLISSIEDALKRIGD